VNAGGKGAPARGKSFTQAGVKPFLCLGSLMARLLDRPPVAAVPRRARESLTCLLSRLS
jgi:hypothetical protein